MRWVVSTPDSGDRFGRVELRGHVCATTRMLWIQAAGHPGHRDVRVRYDRGEPHLPRHHRAEDLEPA